MPPVGAAIAAFVTSAATAAGIGAVAATWIGAASVRLLASIALTAVQVLLMTKKNKSALGTGGLRTSVTQTGGTNPISFVVGTMATAGAAVCPPMSHGDAGKTPNAYLTYVIELGAIRGMELTDLIIDGQYVTIGSVSATGYGNNIDGKWANKAWIKYYDGSQTTADAQLIAKYGSYPSRPWSSSMIGRDLCYAIVTFLYDPVVYNSYPVVRFVVGGIPLYDPRKDSSVGGSGSQRWANVSTWQPSNNTMVQVYNIVRGITFADGTVWGGEYEAADLPLSEWFAAMNACDALVEKSGSGTEAAYRSGMEIEVSDEPADVIDELLKACSGQITEVGGILKPMVGSVSMPVLFITDDEILVSESSEYDPFPASTEVFNGVSATYPEPISLYESVSAPTRYNSNYETEDGRRLMADLQIPAAPYKEQVQRLMRAYLKDARRFRRHSITLGPRAMPIEPLDSISWTSEANGYSAKVFEVGAVSDDLTIGTQGLSIRERDPSDYDWDRTLVLPSEPAPGVVITPTAQGVPGFAVSPINLASDITGTTKPAIQMTWDGDGLPDVSGVRYRIRKAGVIILRGSVLEAEDGQLVVADGILGSTSYEVSARLVSRRRATSWSAWESVTTFSASLIPPSQNYTTDGTNMVPNSAMNDPQAWNLYANAVFVDGDRGLGSMKDVRYNFVGGTGSPTVVDSLQFPITEGERYRVSASYFGAAGDTYRAILLVVFYTAIGGFVSTVTADSVTVLSTGANVSRFNVITAPAGATLARVRLQTNLSITNADFRVGNFRLQRMNAAQLIDDATITGSMIVNSTITDSKISGDIKSTGFVSGPSGTGWRIDKAGGAEFNTVTIRRNLMVSSGSISLAGFSMATYAGTGAGATSLDADWIRLTRTIYADTTGVPMDDWFGLQKSYIAAAGFSGLTVTANGGAPPDVYWGVVCEVMPLTRWSAPQNVKLKIEIWTRKVLSFSACSIDWRIYEVS